MRKSRYSTMMKWIAPALLVLTVAGCSPSPQVITANPIGTPVTGPLTHIPSQWQTIVSAAQSSTEAGPYMVKMLVSTAQGSLHSSFSVYGGIDPSGLASLSITANGASEGFYQQGKSAYAKDPTGWIPVPALKSINLYEGYMALAAQAEKANVPIQKIQDHVFVVDEYCSVYQAIVPAALIQPSPFDKSIPVTTSHVVYTFYVGDTSGYLREITTESVGSVGDVGAMQVNSDTELFGIGKPTTQIKIPNDLFATLSR